MTSITEAPADDDYITPCGEIDIRTPAPVIACLSASLSDFWSGQLNQVVSEKVVVAPTAAQVPTDCRPGLTAAPAFTCYVDGVLYVTSGFAAHIAQNFRSSDFIYAYAALLAHEMGHVVQKAVDQPGLSDDAQSAMIEQQADCLSGVWAAAKAAAGQLDADAYVFVADKLVTDVSTPAEIATHGTPAVRKAALTTGLDGGRPQSCRLATFS